MKHKSWRLLGLLLTFPIVQSLLGQWTNDPKINTPVSSAIGAQQGVQIIDDGQRGAMIVWCDQRRGVSINDIYAQRLNSSGFPLWTTNGIPISFGVVQGAPVVKSDGFGGAIILWSGKLADTQRVYAQRINAMGNNLWPVDGVPVGDRGLQQLYPSLICDGAGGTIISWENSDDNFHFSIYAQHIDSVGNPLWSDSGKAICTESSSQPLIESGGAGGAIVVWQDARNGNYDIFAQRIDKNGEIKWSTNGAPVTTASGDQRPSDIISDGSGGVIATYNSFDGSIYDVYAQRIDSSGNSLWQLNGIPICATGNSAYFAKITKSNIGAYIMAWADWRNGALDCRVYAQYISNSGHTYWGCPKFS